MSAKREQQARNVDQAPRRVGAERHRNSPAMVASDPFDRVLAALREHGAQFRYDSPDRVRATCPAHPDRKPSLAITRREDRVLMRCFAGCHNEAIVRAIGLRLADLFSGPRTARARADVVAVYAYCDGHGAVIAHKVRFAPKAFSWRRVDPSARVGWRWGLGDGVVGLYQRPNLLGARVVSIVEGEKAAELLTSLGFVATCPPFGASTWKSNWSSDLLEAGCRELVILADHDPAGERHAEHVAADIHARQCDEPFTVKVVLLPGLVVGGDVVDWLDAGHRREDLLEVVASTPVWSPGAAERRRATRRAEQAKERMRRLRANKRRGARPNSSGRAVHRDADALAAVTAMLEAAEPCSGRTIWKALKGGAHPRAAIDRALGVGITTGTLVAEGGDQRGRAKLYRRGSDRRCVTNPGHSPRVRTVTAPGHPMSVPADGAGTPRDPGGVSTEISLSQRPVTPFAVTQGERSSYPLQEKEDLPRPTGVTGSGTVRVPEAEAVPEAQQRAIEADHCCGENGAELRCRLCRWSPTYFRRDESALTRGTLTRPVTTCTFADCSAVTRCVLADGCVRQRLPRPLSGPPLQSEVRRVCVRVEDPRG